MTIVAIILAVVVGAVAVVLIYAATKPDAFRVARETTIDAPAENIFPLINDLQRFKLWSPYEDKDPGMKRTVSTPSAGQGATYAWDGDGKVGAGMMTITDVSQPSRVAIRLDLLRPFAATNAVTFKLTPRGSGTDVEWAMEGASPYLTKVMTTVFSMDKMVGGDFEKGLAKLKRVAEQ